MRPSVGGVMSTGGELQAHNAPVINKAIAHLYAARMWLLLLEALSALLILVFIIWWTMFSGRSRGERRDDWENVDAGRRDEDTD
jgi:hypothetical protein